MLQEKCVEPKDVEYTYDEAVELTGHGRYNHLVLVACSVISNAVALDMFAFGLILATASCDLQLGIWHIGLLGSIPFAGLLFAFPWGYYADISGRRRALLLSCSVGFIMAAVGSLSPNWQTLLVMKLVGCSFSTASFSLTMTYLGECTGNKHRSQYMFIMNSINLFSEAVTFMLALAILPLTFNIPIPWLGVTYRPWRLLTLILAIPLGVGAAMMWFLHESPKFLANRGYNDTALEVLRKIFEANGGRKDEYQVKSISKTMETQKKEPFWQLIVQQTVPIFKPPLLWRTIQLFYLMMLCCAINNIFVMWYPTIVNSFFTSLSYGVVEEKSFCDRFVSNLTADPSETGDWSCNDIITPSTIYTGIMTGFFYTGLNLSVSKLAKWRRSVLLTIYLIPGICMVLTNVVKEPIVSLIMFALVQGTAIGIGVVASYFVDLYPTSYRALVTSLALMTARLGSLSGINIIGHAMTTNCEMTFYCCAALVFSGVAVTLLLPSDKKSNG
ncbi:uncharacterized protein LOC134755360 [Cydia strobilella]|uniref:uncharacterized protein LOC134755360 n=1 Tax=Cydia strobilella TaxID=1100964 RepID=UPI0030064380